MFFGLTQSGKNLVVEAKLQCKRSSVFIIRAPKHQIFAEHHRLQQQSREHTISQRKASKIITLIPTWSSRAQHGATSRCAAVLPAPTPVATFSLHDIKRATRPISPSLDGLIAPLLALPPIFEVILPLPQLILDTLAKLTLEWVDVEIVWHVLIGRRREQRVQALFGVQVQGLPRALFAEDLLF